MHTANMHTERRSIVCQDEERALKKSTSQFLVILTTIMPLLLLLQSSSSSHLPINPMHVNRFRLLRCVEKKFYELTFQGGMTSNRYAGEMTNNRRQKKRFKQQRRMTWQAKRNKKRKERRKKQQNEISSCWLYILGQTKLEFHDTHYTMLMIF